MPEPQAPSFKILLVGDSGVGKTTLVKRFLDGDFRKEFIPSLSAVVHPLVFPTTQGAITFNVWDPVGGQHKFGGLRDAFYLQGQGAIIMFDVTSSITYQNVATWYNTIKRICEDIPIVLCGNKIDSVERKVQADRVTFHREHKLQYFEMSAKADHDIQAPFLQLARDLLGNPGLQFVQPPSLAPPEAFVDDKMVQRYNEQMRGAIDLP